MLRIGFDASPLLNPVSGVEWHTYHLFRSLFALDQSDVRFVGYLPRGKHPTGNYAAWIQSGKLQWARMEISWGRWRTRTSAELDLFHGTNFKMPIRGRYGGIVTVHDLWLDRFPGHSKKLFGQMPSFFRTRRTARKARRVVAVSRCTAGDICEFYGVPEDHVALIPNGVSPEFFVEEDAAVSWRALARYPLPSRRFVLFVGGASPRKNHRLLLNALARSPGLLKTHCLVVIGQIHDRSENIMDNAEGLGVRDRVVCVGQVDVSALRHFYNLAELFVFPSLYEGFGMPVLEAMACKTPVIIANAGALPEVAGDAAMHVDPQDVDGLAKAMHTVLADSGLRTTLEKKGIARAKQFVWTESAQKTMDVYRDVCRMEDSHHDSSVAVLRRNPQ